MILLIEDNPEYREMAKAALEAAEVSYKIFEDYGSFIAYFKEFVLPKARWISATSVITDMFFPIGNWECRGEQAYRDMGEAFNKPQPLGLAVAMLCQKHGIPCQTVTDKFHHSVDMEWINQCQGDILSLTPHYTKNWAGAIKDVQNARKKE